MCRVLVLHIQEVLDNFVLWPDFWDYCRRVSRGTKGQKVETVRRAGKNSTEEAKKCRVELRRMFSSKCPKRAATIKSASTSFGPLSRDEPIDSSPCFILKEADFVFRIPPTSLSVQGLYDLSIDDNPNKDT